MMAVKATRRTMKDPELDHEWVGRCVWGYRKDLKYPILYGVAQVLDGKITPREGLVALMEKYPLRLEEFPF